MRCIFCKCNSDNTTSREHIIPESLGNKSHILPTGTVCEKCNNYFAVKIERELLNKPYFKSLRHRNEIPNKKKNLPTETGFINHPEGGLIEVAGVKDNVLEVIIQDTKVFDLVRAGKANTLFIPIISLPSDNDLIISRFLAKVAFEALAYKICKVQGWNEELVENAQYDNIRNFARFGDGKPWPYHLRRIYSEEELFVDLVDGRKPQPYQVLHEFDFLFIEQIHLYFVCAIMGVEYAINIADRTVKHYLNWLELNDNKSPLEKEHQKKFSGL